MPNQVFPSTIDFDPENGSEARLWAFARDLFHALQVAEKRINALEQSAASSK